MSCNVQDHDGEWISHQINSNTHNFGQLSIVIRAQCTNVSRGPSVYMEWSVTGLFKMTVYFPAYLLDTCTW